MRLFTRCTVSFVNSKKSDGYRRSVMNIDDGSYESISSSLKFDQCVSYDADWSAAPDFLKLIIDSALEDKPEVIVECSSGVTTLVLARCCQLNGAGHVYSLENGDEHARETIRQLERFGLSEYADVLHAPLEATEIGSRQFEWYGLEELAVDKIDMLVIDGPPGYMQEYSRYPALPKLLARLNDGCKIFLDDAGRSDERQIVESWVNEYPGLEHRYIDNERGCSVLDVIS